jgi:hypothetical protein
MILKKPVSIFLTSDYHSVNCSIISMYYFMLLLKKPYPLFSICFFLLLMAGTSCHQRNNEDYITLRDYAAKMNFPLTTGNYYLLFPGNQCKNCFLFNASRLPKEFNQRIYFISGFPDKHIQGFEHFIYDVDNTMMSLKFLNYGSKIISLEAENTLQVSALRDFEFQMDSIMKLEKQQQQVHSTTNE